MPIILLWLNKNYLSKINDSLFESCFDTSRPTYKKIMHPTKLQKSEILSLFNSLLKEYHSDEFASEVCAYGILLQIMTVLNRVSLGTGSHRSDKFGTPTLITDVLLYINEHYNEEISLDSLANHFFVSKYHLSHEFSKAVGTSLHRYITLKRLNIAHEMLTGGIAPSNASSQCGFGD